MVATTIGIMPKRSSGSTIDRLNAQPSTTTDTRHDNRNATSSGAPMAMKPSIMKAGSITNSPWAKLMVPAACHSRVKPSAARA